MAGLAGVRVREKERIVDFCRDGAGDEGGVWEVLADGKGISTNPVGIKVRGKHSQ